MKYTPGPTKPDTRNLLFALAMCAALITGWQYFIEIPKRKQLAEWNLQQQEIQKQRAIEEAKQKEVFAQQFDQSSGAVDVPSPRLAISTPNLHGSLALKGLRFDDLTLVRYRQELDPASPEVVLLTKGSGEALPYFAQIGWLSDKPGISVPNENTVWEVEGEALTPETPVTLSWYSPQDVQFRLRISIDKAYMFTIEPTVINHGSETVTLKPYALLNRGYKDEGMHMLIMHEGPIGTLNSELKEISYEELREANSAIESPNGWLGFTDKYWLTAFIPDASLPFKANFTYYQSKENDRYQVDYLSAPIEVVPGGTAKTRMHFFAGAKEIEALDTYAAGVQEIGLPPVPLFDRAVDLGSLYFLTKPIFIALNYFYKLTGNFGIAILLLTFVVKLSMFPVANKGYRSMTQMKALQPELTRIRNQYSDDKLKMQQEMIGLYRKERVNPASGCLPLLIQLPVFFALYKVLFVTIEMRHARFFGPWKDLSAMDPTNLFTAFGLIPWNPPGFLMLGILPLLMTLTMIIQMKQQPPPPDPTQAKVMKLMPWFLLILIHRMPAGLILYWVFSNILSILQQHIITKRHRNGRNTPVKAKKPDSKKV